MEEIFAQAASVIPTSDFEVLVSNPDTGVAQKATISSILSLSGGPSQAVVDTVTGNWVHDPIYVLRPQITRSIGGTVSTIAGVTVQKVNIDEFLSPNGLATLTHTNLAAVEGDYKIVSSVGLQSVSAPELVYVGGDFNFTQLDICNGFNFPKLEYVGGSIDFSESSSPGAAQFSFELPSLRIIDGQFYVVMNFLANVISLPKLERAWNLYLEAGYITSLSLPELTHTNWLHFQCGQATSLSCPKLVVIGDHDGSGGLEIHDSLSLTSVSLPLVKVLGAINIYDEVVALTTLELPSIERIYARGLGAYKSISIVPGDNGPGATALTTFTLGASLKYVENDVEITAAALNQTSVDGILVRLAALDGTNGTTEYSNLTVTITGTSAAPSATGLAAKATLIARGCTVTHN